MSWGGTGGTKQKCEPIVRWPTLGRAARRRGCDYLTADCSYITGLEAKGARTEAAVWRPIWGRKTDRLISVQPPFEIKAKAGEIASVRQEEKGKRDSLLYKERCGSIKDQSRKWIDKTLHCISDEKEKINNIKIKTKFHLMDDNQMGSLK